MAGAVVTMYIFQVSEPDISYLCPEARRTVHISLTISVYGRMFNYF